MTSPLPTTAIEVASKAVAKSIMDGVRSDHVSPIWSAIGGEEHLLVCGGQAVGVIRLGDFSVCGKSAGGLPGVKWITKRSFNRMAKEDPSWLHEPYWVWPIESVEKLAKPLKIEKDGLLKIAIADISPEALGEETDRELLSIHLRLHQLFASNFAGNDQTTISGMTREDLVNAELFVQDEFIRRGFEHDIEDQLTEEAEQLRGLTKVEFAPINPSGRVTGSEIELGEVMQYFDRAQKAILRLGEVSLVGGIVNDEKTCNDVDILVKGPIGPELRQVIEFRLGRMLPPELSERISFVEDDMGGPFGPHIELADLQLSFRSQFEFKEMRAEVEKQGDPLSEMPKKSGPRDAVVQAHARGKTVHLDIRHDIGKALNGITIANQKAGMIREPVETLADGRRIAKTWDVDGSAFFKSMLAPAGVFATAKKIQPRAWLKLEDSVFEPGSIGATKFEEGVIINVDRPKVEFGAQERDFHEWFYTSGKKLNGILSMRLLPGEDEPFWRVSVSKEFLPLILKRRSVNSGRMPPDGFSWIPKTLEDVTPAEFRYWKAKGAEAKKIRDDLVDSRFFTARNVRMVGKEFRRVEVEKSYVYVTKHLPNRVPEAGIHLHNLERSSDPPKTKFDGAHPHFFVLPNGDGVWTHEDGEHGHPLSSSTANEVTGSGEHVHKVTMPDGMELATEMDGPHGHQLQVWSSAFDGIHTHRLALPDGSSVQTQLPGEYYDHRGMPDQTDVPPGPSATMLAGTPHLLKRAQPMEKACRLLKLADMAPEDLPRVLEPIFEAEGFSLERDNPLAKEGEQRVVLGVMLEPETEDTQGDIYSADEVRQAAVNAGPVIGHMHERKADEAELLGDYIARKAFSVDGEIVKKDTWLSLIFIGDAKTWAEVQSGELGGLSIGGKATGVEEPAS